jgi:hypothetical protein
MKERIFTKNCKFRQQTTLFITGFMLFIFIIFLFTQFSSNTLILFFIDITVSFFINFLVGKLYEIEINFSDIYIENMWGKANLPLEQLDDIRLIHFMFYYPFNPYIKFVFKNGKSYSAISPNRLKNYLSTGRIDRYMINLKAELIRQ